MHTGVAQNASMPVSDPEQWVDQCGDYLFRYALMRLRNHDAARDAVQETFLAAIKSLDRYDGRVEIRFWLRGILRFKIIDHMRKTSREQSVDTQDGHEILDSLLFKASGIPTIRPEAWKIDPGQAIMREEFWPVFESCLGKLKDLVRQAFVLKTVDDMETEEVCKVLEISPNHLWVLNHRARTQLKKCIEAHWTPEGL
ncbi:MAG TPA: sigma-70 family RNA polymerase sigma factor [Kiritimatiellia bacterium]|nr:sigma-70 family RNA polymerase sigma factor [Kiritimatiellia bacterium]